MDSSQSTLSKHVSLHCEINNWNVTDGIRNRCPKGMVATSGQRILKLWMEKEELECVSHTLRSRQMFTKTLVHNVKLEIKDAYHSRPFGHDQV